MFSAFRRPRTDWRLGFAKLVLAAVAGPPLLVVAVGLLAWAAPSSSCGSSLAGFGVFLAAGLFGLAALLISLTVESWRLRLACWLALIALAFGAAVLAAPTPGPTGGMDFTVTCC